MSRTRPIVAQEARSAQTSKEAPNGFLEPPPRTTSVAAERLVFAEFDVRLPEPQPGNDKSTPAIVRGAPRNPASNFCFTRPMLFTTTSSSKASMSAPRSGISRRQRHRRYSAEAGLETPCSAVNGRQAPSLSQRPRNLRTGASLLDARVCRAPPIRGSSFHGSGEPGPRPRRASGSIRQPLGHADRPAHHRSRRCVSHTSGIDVSACR